MIHCRPDLRLNPGLHAELDLFIPTNRLGLVNCLNWFGEGRLLMVLNVGGEGSTAHNYFVRGGDRTSAP